MKMLKLTTLIAAALLLCSETAYAQSAQDDRQREMESREQEMAERLREAEKRMEVAAREIAEITRSRLPQVAQIERRIEVSNKPRIGVTIDTENSGDPVEGVLIGGVTPGSAADDAGLRAGDIITAVNGESMTAENRKVANIRLLDFMKGVEEGDELSVSYLRNGNNGTVELTPRVSEMHMFSWMPDMGQLQEHRVAGVVAPADIDGFRMKFGFPFAASAWGSMELVELNEGLGKYFGTDNGLLIVSAPDSDTIDLRDGDVIQSIDGREPKSVRHAMRILSSYQSGESLELGIMRDKKKRKIEVEVPANQRGSLFAPPAAKPVKVPVAPKAPRAPVETAST